MDAVEFEAALRPERTCLGRAIIGHATGVAWSITLRRFYERSDCFQRASDREPSHAERISNCLAALDREGVAYGKVFGIELFERELMLDRASGNFGWAIQAIRENLESLGFHLSAAGQNGQGYVIVGKEKNTKVANARRKRARRQLKRGLCLVLATSSEGLSQAQLLELEKMREKTGLELEENIGAKLTEISQAEHSYQAEKRAIPLN
jgi:hypothetical protein